MFFFGFNLTPPILPPSPLQPVEKAHGRSHGAGSRKGKMGLLLVKRTRSDGRTQGYWIRPEDYQKMMKVEGKKNPLTGEDLYVGDKIQKRRNARQIAESLKLSRVKMKQKRFPKQLAPEALWIKDKNTGRRSLLDRAATTTGPINNSTKKKGPEPTPEELEANPLAGGRRWSRPSQYYFESVVKAVRQRSKDFKETVSGLKNDATMAAHRGTDPRVEAREAIKALSESVPPEKREEVLSRLPHFYRYFAQAVPHHTGSFESTIISALTGKFIPGKSVRSMIDARRQAELGRLKARIEPMNVAQMHDYYAGPLAGPIKDLDDKIFRYKDRDTSLLSETELRRHKNHLEEAEKLRNSITQNQNLAATKDNKNIEKVRAGLQKHLQDVFLPAEKVGAASSYDARVNADSKIFVAMHSASRYQALSDRPVTLVFPRSSLAQEGATIALTNIPQYGEAKALGSDSLRTLPKSLHHEPADVINGKGLLHNLDSHDTIMALALHAAINNKSVDEYLSTYVGHNLLPKTERPGLSASPEDHAKYTTDTQERKDYNSMVKEEADQQGWTTSKPFFLSEGHLPGAQEFSSAEHLVFKNEEDHDAFLNIFDGPDRVALEAKATFPQKHGHETVDQFIREIETSKLIDVAPFEYVDGQGFIQRR